MTVREYLEQGRMFETLINSKLAQVTALNELAAKYTSCITGILDSSDSDKPSVPDTEAKIVVLQADINADINALIDLKSEMVRIVNSVGNREYQTLLELRYLCGKSWDEVAGDMCYTLRHIYRLHNEALDRIETLLKTSAYAMRNEAAI